MRFKPEGVDDPIPSLFADLTGFAGISLVCIITIILAMRYPRISNFLYIALALRVSTLLLGHYVVELPDSTRDANSFENRAWMIALAADGFLELFDYYEGPSARFISWLIAFPYELIGRSVLMAKSMTLFFGMGSVFLAWKLSKKLWGYQIANKIGWVMALFPSLILYSALIMREAYICFFLLIAIYGVVKWEEKRDVKSIILSILGFTGATFFHGATIIGAMVFVGIIGLITIRDFFKSIFYVKISVKNLVFLISIFFVFFLYLSNYIYVPYLGNFESLIDPHVLKRKARLSVSGLAAYPEWLVVRDPVEFIYKIPIRGLYFMFAPFPWDVKAIRHLIGMFDGFLYIYLVFLILKNIKTIWKNFALRIILLILLAYVAAFALGVGNFGSGIRHRSKFVFMFILLAGPFIKNFIFKKKIKQT
tara:strand:+ start:2572 stop:3837 length:1266 start_codon:yes stop_codon:yes gene_type:complete